MKDITENPIYNPLTLEREVISIITNWFEAEKGGDVNARNHATGKIGKYLVETADSSFTLRSSARNNSSETMHTAHGALSEARIKFVEPLNIWGNNEVRILDICSGLGINTAAALEAFFKANNKSKSDINNKSEVGVNNKSHFNKNNKSEFKQIEIDMVEVSWETLAASLIIPSPIKSHSLVKKTVETYLINQKILMHPWEKGKVPDNVNIRVHCQDARKVLINIPKNQKYDAVFLDPFSPQKSPELYTQEFILKIRDLLTEDGVLLTYTSSAPLRYALIDAGLQVGEGPSMGRSGGTIASPDIKKIPKPLNNNDERMIALSDAGIPFKDPQLTSLPENIKQQRQKERIKARGNYKIASTVKTPVYLARDIDDEKIKRRALKHLKDVRITGLDCEKSRYLVCPQFSECICTCKQERLSTSRARIKEMEKRLTNITNSK
jgi:tRNA U34 5-methylaminomethyl-2-thiouridine-forming methyltransferase MnmC